ncbi:MAG TPA: HAD family hydrolase [Bacteroidales bacterium]|nr:HAD family hydrolase [Bacteroidales bacterium]
MKNRNTYAAIIFDLDGTLADTLDDIAGSMNYVLRLNGYPERPVNDYKLLVGRGLDNLVKQALPEKDRQEKVIRDCLHEMIEHYDSNCIVKTRLYDGIKPMLLKLAGRNIKMSVFSNKAEPLTIKIVEHLLPDIGFQHVMGAGPDFPKKPDPSGALHICRKMAVDPRNTVYVGDSDVDMITANKAGMYAVGVSWGFRSREELKTNGAAIIVDNPERISHLFL